MANVPGIPGNGSGAEPERTFDQKPRAYSRSKQGIIKTVNSQPHGLPQFAWETTPLGRSSGRSVPSIVIPLFVDFSLRIVVLQLNSNG